MDSKADRNIQAFRLRESGMAYKDVAHRLGYSSAATARDAAIRGCKKLRRAKAEGEFSSLPTRAKNSLACIGITNIDSLKKSLESGVLSTREGVESMQNYSKKSHDKVLALCGYEDSNAIKEREKVDYCIRYLESRGYSVSK